MKKFLLWLCFYNCAIATPLQDHPIPLNSFKELCIGLEVPVHENIVSETQKKWIRPSQKERWEIEEISAHQKEFVFSWAEKEGHFEPWKPSLNAYDQIVILGASTPRMKLRLEYVENLIKEGMGVNSVVWLASERPLDDKVDDCSTGAKTEIEAAQILWEKSPLYKGSLPVQFFSTPMKGDKRPATEDILKTFTSKKEEGSRLLFISNQPFCGAQFETIKNTLPHFILFDVAGPGCNRESLPSMAAVFLDSLARWIYQKAQFNEQFSQLNER